MSHFFDSWAALGFHAYSLLYYVSHLIVLSVLIYSGGERTFAQSISVLHTVYFIYIHIHSKYSGMTRLGLRVHRLAVEFVPDPVELLVRPAAVPGPEAQAADQQLGSIGAVRGEAELASL